jgi:competence protein ComEC
MIEIKRPIIWAMAAYATGIATSAWIGQHIFVLFGLALSAVITAWILNRNNRQCFHFILTALFVIGALNLNIAQTLDDPFNDVLGVEATFLGHVERVIEYADDRDAYVVLLNKALYGEIKIEDTAKIRLNVFTARENVNAQRYEKGDILGLTGGLEIPRGRRNPAGFDYRQYLARRGIHYTLSTTQTDIEKVGEKRFSITSSFMEFVRNRVHAVFSESVGGREGALMIAMMLGDRWLLPYDLTIDFRQTGLSHIIAISGLHVGFILLMLDKMLNILPLSKKMAIIFKIVILWFYCILTGATPSVLRAVFMATVYLGAKFAGRRPDALNSLALAALGILVIRPSDFFDIGFQLSFSAVLGMILLYKKIKNSFGSLPEWLSSTLAVMLSAQLGVVPLIAYYFNMFSPVSIPANLVFVPLSGFMVCFGFIVMSVGVVFPMLAEMIGWPLKIATWLFIEGAQIASEMPMAFVNIVSPSLLALACFYFAILILSDEKPLWVKNVPIWCAVLFLIPLLHSTIQPLIDNNLKIVFIDVGQGDSIYIKTPDEKHILIDGGGRLFDSERGFEPGEDIVVPFMLKNGVGRLDLLVKSHDHSDHIGGLRAVASSLSIGTFMEYPPSEGSDRYQALKSIIDGKEIHTIKAYAGQVYSIGRYVTLEVFYPDAQGLTMNRFYDGDDNNRSLVFLLRYKDAEVLFTGDIYADVEEYISKEWNKDIDILKVAHHGSRTSTSEYWLDSVNPYLAVIQVGNNNFGHPHEEVIERLEEHGTKIFRNDIHGAVICEFDGENWTIRSMIQ